MPYVLVSKSLYVEFEEDSSQFIITDRRVGKIWKQAPFPACFKVEKTEIFPEENKLVLEITGENQFILTVTLENDNEVLYTLSADPEYAMEAIAFPPAIQAPDANHYILQTDSEGILLPVDDCGYPLGQEPMYRCSGGPAMSWIGMVDAALEAGFMNIYETPYDTEIKTYKRDGLICFEPVWLSSMRKFSYDRKMRAVFFDKGGYVAQCKRYRSYAWEKHQVRTLSSKLDRFPAMEKMLGAVHVYLWDDARQKEFVREMKESGIEKALVFWHGNHLPYPNTDLTEAVKEIGYGIGNHETLSDIQVETPQRIESLKQRPLLQNVYPGQFDYLTAKTKDGTTYSNRYATYVCPAANREAMKERIERLLKDYPDETLFLDVYQANGLYECYDERHPLTREGYAKGIIDNMKFLEDEYGLYLGSEFGSDFAAAHGNYVYGMMTLQRTWFDSDNEVPGTIYYIGNWRNNSRPSIILGSRVAPPTYHKYSINTYTRVPLYELVYHDAVVTTWRWEDCNHHYADIWWKKDLYNVLYGNVPLWCIDRSRFEDYKTTFVESYQKVLPWVQKVCLDEMVSHRFLTEDHTVQEAVYSSGKSVVVNFGDQDYVHNGDTIPARDYMTYEG